MVRNLLNSDFVQDKDPFRSYFESLPEWTVDSPDYIGQLAQTIKTPPEQWAEFLKKWMVAVVACAIDPQVVNHQVLVLVGKQGAGKSTWLNNLLPRQLQGYLYSGVINPNNKDTLINLSENLLINLDELEYLNKSELGNLKALITQSAIRLRKAYGIYTENFQRRASFMGSVNSADFLTDTTGNRRYLCFNCISIDNSHRLNIDAVYSQAYALYKQGFKYWFDGAEIGLIEQLNDQFLRISREEELLLTYLEKPGAGEPFEWWTTTDIAVQLKGWAKVDVSDAASVRRLGQALAKHEYQRKSTGNTKPYKVKVRSLAEKAADSEEPEIRRNSTAEPVTVFDGQTQMEVDIEALIKSLPREFFLPVDDEED
jgi:hypothetical protein